jgi:hypothetical protein
MEELHSAVAEALKEGVTAKNPRAIAEAIKFLKNNGIEAARDANNSAVSRLADQVNRIMAEDAGDDYDRPVGNA